MAWSAESASHFLTKRLHIFLARTADGVLRGPRHGGISMLPMKVAPWFWILAALIACAELLAFSALCQAQVDGAQARRVETQVQDAVFGNCLDQFDALTIGRCRLRFAPRP
jgi:hypothetical protein